jgi:diguanylate cyclase (GGDEF)-like protein
VQDTRAPAETLAALQGLKRRIYIWALGVGLLATLAGWGFRAFGGTFTLYERLIFPFMAVACLAMLIVLWRTPRAPTWVESVLFAMTAFSLLGRLVEVLITPETVIHPDKLAEMADLLYWFPLVYILAFLIFESRRRLLVDSLLFFGALLLIGLVYTFYEWQTQEDMVEAYVLGRFYLANVIYIVLLAAGVRLSEQYLRARTLTETMTHLAHIDPLIRVANRRELEATMAREKSRADRYKQPLALVMFDIDHFKQVNDTYGHEAGDAVLKEAACAMQGLLRASDLLGRWGGDEFLVIAPQTDAPQAGVLAERLRHGLSALVFEQVGGITGTFGVAEFHPQEIAADWLKRADAALYAAKQAGRNCVATAP